MTYLNCSCAECLRARDAGHQTIMMEIDTFGMPPASYDPLVDALMATAHAMTWVESTGFSLKETN